MGQNSPSQEINMKFLFLVTDFDVGGITASLRNLTALLCAKNHTVDILNLPMSEKLPDGFDERITLIPLDKRSRLWRLSSNDVKRAKGFKKIKYLFLGALKKIMNRSEAWVDYAFKNLRFDGYDAVIGFRQSPVCFYLASRKACGAKKIGFWHGDIDFMGDVSGWSNYLYELDCVACVSSAVRDSVKKRFPDLEEKLCVVYNVFAPSEIEDALGADAPELTESEFNIVTVSRIDFVHKQLQIIPEICQRLKQDGHRVLWHIIGDGPEREQLSSLILKCGVDDCLILHGARSNPFPYYKKADLFVLTSKTESYGMVVVESLICGTPVVAGEYPALHEILSDGENGMIAENSADGIYEAIKRILVDASFYKKIKRGAQQYSYTSDTAYDQFMQMF